jgi:preprotein translocase subunit SecG
METLLTLIHVLIAVLLIGLVLIQDSKGGALGIGGSTSNSLLGAGGAQSLAAKATRWVAVIFAITCISLSLWTAKKTQSVVSGAIPQQAAPVVPNTTEIPAPNDPAAAAAGTAAAPTTAPAAAPEKK